MGIIKLNELLTVDKNTINRWCQMPYPKNKKGCPMYGTRATCPPYTPMWDILIEPPFFLVYKEFSLKDQEDKMRAKHPNWSKKMCRNPRYWQKGLMRDIMKEAEDFLLLFPNGRILERPEANGVFLLAICKRHGIKIDRIPKDTVTKMVVVGNAR